jgi:hypothetical protein
MVEAHKITLSIRVTRLAIGTIYLKDEGFVLFASARPVNSHEQWVAYVEGTWKDLRNPDAQWWAELRMLYNSI